MVSLCLFITGSYSQSCQASWNQTEAEFSSEVGKVTLPQFCEILLPGGMGMGLSSIVCAPCLHPLHYIIPQNPRSLYRNFFSFSC